MIFVNLMTLKPHLSRQQIDQVAQQRARWRTPRGMTLLAEYWVQGSPQVISIVEAESINVILTANFQFNDSFDIQTHPAIGVTDALRELQIAGIVKRRGRRPKALAEAMAAAEAAKAAEATQAAAGDGNDGN